MKTRICSLSSLIPSLALLLAQVSTALSWAAEAEDPPPVYPVLKPAPTVGNVYVYDQRPVEQKAGPSGGRAFLISPEQAQGIIDRFKVHYQKVGAPRVLIYVNRDLIDENSGLKLSAQRRVVETTHASDPSHIADTNGLAKIDAARRTDRVVSTNIFRVRDRKELTLADRQTMRDVERLIGRPLRMAGVRLADQQVASQITASGGLDQGLVQPESEQARKERDVLTKVADVVLEVLVASHELTAGDGGNEKYTVPDLQVTAIRLNDAQILGQATAADLIGQGSNAAKAVRNYGVREITEATALSLMEDMMLQ